MVVNIKTCALSTTTIFLLKKILHRDAPCPRFTQLANALKLGENYLNQTKINQPFIDMLKNTSGLSSLAIGSIYDLGDKFLIQVGLKKEHLEPFCLRKCEI